MYLSRIHQLFSRDLKRFGGWQYWLLFRCLPMLVFTATSIMILASTSAQAEDYLDGVASGQMLLREEGEAYQPAPAQSTKVDLVVTGMLATVTVEQEFHNAGADWVEGVYAFPLPEEAAVRRLEMLIGERRIVGKIRERKEAKRVYQQALKQGKKGCFGGAAAAELIYQSGGQHRSGREDYCQARVRAERGNTAMDAFLCAYLPRSRHDTCQGVRQKRQIRI